MTEAEVLKTLRHHYLFDRGTERGNGDEWGFMPHVRNKAGMSASRTCDLIVFGLWPSRGLPIIGHEIKCSRSDWLTELKKPAKADMFHELVDAWYLVVADEAFVQPGELPDGWGLMVIVPGRAKGTVKIKVVTVARMKPKEERPGLLDRQFVAAMLKVSCRTMDATPEEIQAATQDAREREQAVQEQLMRLKDEQIAELLAAQKAFETASGVTLSRWHGEKRAEQVGEALRVVLASDQTVAAMHRKLEGLIGQAESIADQARRILNPEPLHVEFGSDQN